MHHRSNYAMGDDDDRAPLMGARQRRLTGDVPYRDDPVSEEDPGRLPGLMLVTFSHSFAHSISCLGMLLFWFMW